MDFPSTRGMPAFHGILSDMSKGSPAPDSAPDSMVDPFGRRVRYLRISVTDRCSLRCFYCMPDGLDSKYERSEVLTIEETARLARIFHELGVEKIRITGGEPLLRKGVVDLVRDIRSLPRIRDLAMTTNALALAHQAQDLKDAGLDRVNVSLDSLDRLRFQLVTKYDGLDKVLAGVDEALKVGLNPVKINVVVMRGVNDDEALAFADWAARAPVTIRFIEYMPFGPGIAGQKDHYVPSSETVGRILKKYDLEPEDESPLGGPSKYYRIPGTEGRLGFISPIDTGFCGDCNRVRLTAVGKLRLCLFSDEGIDLRGPLRAGESDSQIRARIQESLKIKPERHHLQEGIPYEGLAMSQVGG